MINHRIWEVRDDDVEAPPILYMGFLWVTDAHPIVKSSIIYIIIYIYWLVVSTPRKNISQLGLLFPIYGKINNVPNHQPDICDYIYTYIYILVHMCRSLHLESVTLGNGARRRLCQVTASTYGKGRPASQRGQVFSTKGKCQGSSQPKQIGPLPAAAPPSIPKV